MSESAGNPTEDVFRGLDPQQKRRVLDFLREDQPQDIGPYHIIELLGQGGMGVVYKAEQREPVKRIVALKLIKLGMDTKEVIARFESERQALAMMSHPNVAKVFDAGMTETGRPYFVMEFVPGESITAFCDRKNLSITERLELFTQACEAVQHAHQKAIIHRDLKPSNILVTLDESSSRPGLVKVIDFGVAKAVSQRLTEKTLFTEAGKLIGTPEYMSPEQAEMSALDIDTRSDIYSLGVVLYELLAGALPFDPKSLRSAGYNEIQRIIREVDPPRPSTRLSQLGEGATEVARKRQTQFALLEKQLKRELEWIPLTAMRKERAERYATVAELVQDIRNYLQERPLRAGPPTARYRARKFLRRNRAAVGSAAAILVVLLAGVAGIVWQAIRATRAERHVARQKEQVESKRQEVEAVLGFLIGRVLDGARPDVLPDKSVRDAIVKAMLDPAADAIDESFADRPQVEAAARSTVAHSYTTIGRADLALPHATKAFDIRSRTLGNDAPETIEAANILAEAQMELGKLDLAEQQFRQALDNSRRALGEEHRQTVDSRMNLGNVLMRLGRYAEAEPLLRQALEQERRLGNRARVLIGISHALGLNLMLAGRLQEAEVLFRDALQRSHKDLGPNHTRTIASANHVAQVLEQQGRFAEAKPFFLESLKTSRQVLGDSHMTTMILVNNLGSLLQKMGESDEAEMLYREVVASLRKSFGDQHPSTLTAINNLGVLLTNEHRYVEAEPLLRETLEGRRRALGENHPYTVQSIYGLGNVLVLQQQFEAAEPLLAELYQKSQTAELTPKQAAAFMAEWGYCLVKLKRYAEAEAPLREAHRRLVETDQRTSRPMGRVLGSLAAVCENTNRPDEQRSWQSQLDALLATTRAAPASAPNR